MPVSWEEAYAEIEARLLPILREHFEKADVSNSVVVATDAGRANEPVAVGVDGRIGKRCSGRGKCGVVATREAYTLGEFQWLARASSRVTFPFPVSSQRAASPAGFAPPSR